MFRLFYYDNEELKSSSELKNNFYELKIINQSNQLKVIIKPKKKIHIEHIEFNLPFNYQKDSRIFINGYQSWTETKEYLPSEKLRDVMKLPKKILNKFSVEKYGDSTFKKYRKEVLHSYTFSYIKGNKTIFIGSNNENNSYLIINHHPKNNMIVLESLYDIEIENELVLLDVFIDESIEKGLEKYFGKYKIKKDYHLKGFTSWYNYYQNINEDIILKNLNNIDNKRYNLFQIDDGFEEYIGDWDANKNKFPNGLGNIVKKIHDKKMKAGLWLAPCICETNSRLFKEHKELLGKDKNGNYVCAGSNWSGFYVLDVTKKETKEYIKNVLRKYVKMGFDFFKLDFLYAAGLIYHPNKTRAMIIDEMMTFIRKELKDEIILGCGVPLSSAFGKVDYCRIGPDVSLTFDDVWYMKYLHRERISTKETIQNTIYRSIMSKHVFLNDPDVVVLRDDNNKLNNFQKESLLTMNILLGDLFLSSDDTSLYSKEINKKIDELFKLKSEIVSTKIDRNKNFILIDLKLKDSSIRKLRYDFKKGITYYDN